MVPVQRGPSEPDPDNRQEDVSALLVFETDLGPVGRGVVDEDARAMIAMEAATCIRAMGTSRFRRLD